MPDDSGKLFIGCILGFGGGIYMFFEGFRVYREYRVLADTPEMPIRSIPMGLVEIHGKPRPVEEGKLLTSPVTRTACVFYKVDIEKWEVDDKGKGSWSDVKSVANGYNFYLEDSTGKVLVDAHHAEYDLGQTGQRETSSSDVMTPGVSSSGDDLGSYVARNCPGESSSGKYRLTERCILPGRSYDVTGTCVENPNPRDEHDRNMLVKGQNEPTFLISWRSEREIERELRDRAKFYIFWGAGLAIVSLAFLLAMFSRH